MRNIIQHRRHLILIILKILNSENTRNPSQEAEKELNEYLSMPRVSFEHDPLNWWKVHYESFPSLKVLARKYLCIQGSSVALERVQFRWKRYNKTKSFPSPQACRDANFP
ncbi:hypothetical protein TNCT_298471 [Trichonephila clavata]|uniref:HAT C-terminal dimerisation domain-containing protein n=1 Tax=Trichonephila clavata TaxID=2740835 RepID=A0A8X6M4K9_TRICU|nr:hypothetical protein TNCT_298471 [Trichonephila clavata]